MDAHKIEKSKHYSSNKWTTLDDSIYNHLATLVSQEEQEQIADLLNTFYYFIICYSKTCFKKNANWNNEHKIFTHHMNKKIYTMTNTFDYNLANDLESHSILLKIQKQLYVYRKQYKEFNIKYNQTETHIETKFFTNEKKQEIINFIIESLYDIVKFVSPPVKIISDDVKAKLNKYKHIKSKTRVNLPQKYDTQLLKSILGYDTNITTENNNMIKFSFLSSQS
jgi:hypothetical protein